MNARRDAVAVARLEDLYGRVPVVHCKGLCANECTSITMSDVEHRRMRQRGINVPRVTAENLGRPCPALTSDGRCSEHAIRPMICRLYGATRGNAIACPHDCEIEGKPLGGMETLDLLEQSFDIGGGSMRRTREESLSVLMRALGDRPEVQHIIREAMSPDGRRRMMRKHLRNTVFSPLPRNGKL